jgi:hypothetical protein
MRVPNVRLGVVEPPIGMGWEVGARWSGEPLGWSSSEEATHYGRRWNRVSQVGRDN